MSKQTYRNSLRSENLIKEAVVSLLKKKKDFYSITVSDVCKESNLNRGTMPISAKSPPPSRTI
jgi:hypothetical protein